MEMTCLKLMNEPCIFVIPDIHTSRWMHGRIVSTGWSILLAETATQCPCLSPPDGSYVECDGILIDHTHEMEFHLPLIIKAGGSFCYLSLVNNSLEHEKTFDFSFEPLQMKIDNVCTPLLLEHFPDLGHQLITRLGSNLNNVGIIQGQLNLHGDIHWKALNAIDSWTKKLLTRKWIVSTHTKEDEDKESLQYHNKLEYTLYNPIQQHMGSTFISTQETIEGTNRILLYTNATNTKSMNELVDEDGWISTSRSQKNNNTK